jgi:hypothetical protein
MGGDYRFVAWARAAIGALLDGAQRQATLALGDAGTAGVPLVGYGAGDVVGIDPRAVIRRVPPDGSCDHEPNLFASIELEHPALPWMASPPGAATRTPPWLVLVVVREQPGVRVATTPGSRLTELVVELPARPGDELPDLTQAWAWAHAQSTGAADAPMDVSVLARSAGESRARLIAPRALAPRTAYVACVVPAYAAGVDAMHGATPGDLTALAWTGAETSIRLPVFFAWRFTTGEGGDFASLARALRPEQLAAEVGGRIVDLSRPGWGMPDAPDARVEVGGALRSPAWTAPPPSPAAAALGVATLAAIDAPAPAPGVAPAYPPPMYGAAATRAERSDTAPPWQATLSGDVAQRIAAGLGAELVRADQDALAEAAWREAADAEQANVLVRRAELAAEVTLALARRHIGALASDGEVLSIARPLLRRVRMPAPAPSTPQPTIAAAIERTAMPTAALSPALRRIGRFTPAATTRAPIVAGALLERVEAGAIDPAPATRLAAGAVAFDQLADADPTRPTLVAATPEAIDAAAVIWRRHVPVPHPFPTPLPTPTPHVPVPRGPVLHLRRPGLPDGEGPMRPPVLDPDAPPDPVHIDALRLAARRHQAYVLARLTPRPRPRPRFGHAGARPLLAIRAVIEAQWSPAAGILPILDARIAGVERAGFAPIRITPVLERPLVQLLHRRSPEHVMPGISGLTQDRVALAVTGPDFVRALLVGANEELGRELLWRGFPGALGHTWLRTFWGRHVIGPDGLRTPVPDIPPIEAWPPEGPPVDATQLVLVIRAELLKRYPNAIIYAAPAEWVGVRRRVADVPPTFPVMSARLGEDLAMFGFDLAVGAVRGGVAPPADPGWYFVIAEHPSEPRFGLAARSIGTPARWRDLAWDDLAPDDTVRNHLRVDGPLQQRSLAATPAVAWGTDAAQIAAITLRVPTRVAFHASTLLV